jgi:hypothetical protein
LEKRENPTPIVPTYNSNPTAFAQLFLDFDGNVEPSGWCGTSGAITTQVFSIDGDLNTFSASELSVIDGIWKRMAEDFSPLNINVTTVLPSDFNNKHALRLAIGDQSGGGINWGGIGGIACLGSFYNSASNVVFIVPDGLGPNNAKYMAMAGSHEAGHGFGLAHQDNPPCGGYHGGGTYNFENKGPIMGAPYNATREIWWQGFEGCGTQNDLAIMANSNNGFGYRADDHTNNFADARRFRTSGGTIIGNPAGIIHQTTDIDVWAFTSPAGNASITVGAVSLGPNYDAVVELYHDVAGTPVLLTTVDVAGNVFSATVNYNVPAGKKYLVVKSDGDYGEVGQYSISGTVPAAGAAPGFDGVGFSPVLDREYVDPDVDPNFKGFKCGCPSCMAAEAGLQVGDKQAALATVALENFRAEKLTASSTALFLSTGAPVANWMDAPITVQTEQRFGVPRSIVNTLARRVGPSLLHLDAAVLGDPLVNA